MTNIKQKETCVNISILNTENINQEKKSIMPFIIIVFPKKIALFSSWFLYFVVLSMIAVDLQSCGKKGMSESLLSFFVMC